MTITTLAISDPIAGAVTCPVTTLAPGAIDDLHGDGPAHRSPRPTSTRVWSATPATATAKNPGGATVTSNASSTATAVAQTNTLALAKSGGGHGRQRQRQDRPGRQDRLVASWSTNTGTVTLTDLAVSDPKAGAVTCPVTTLAPGAQTTCTATAAYVITQADVDAGVVNNTATASAKNPGGSTVTSTPSSTSTPVNQVSSLQLTKSAAVTDVNGDGKTDLGDKIAWSFLVKNTGTVTVTTTAITDPKAGATTCPVTTLAPGRLDDLHGDGGLRHHPGRRRRRGRHQHGHRDRPRTRPARRSRRPTSSTSTPVDQASSLQLTKSAAVTDVNGDGKTDLGDTIAWSFLVKNTGTVTINDDGDHRRQGRRDHLPGHDAGAGRLDDVHGDRGLRHHPGRRRRRRRRPTPRPRRGKNPAGATVTSNPSSTDTPVNQAPALQLTKSAAVTDVNGDGKTDLGDRISWSFLVKNTGTTSRSTRWPSPTPRPGARPAR